MLSFVVSREISSFIPGCRWDALAALEARPCFVFSIPFVGSGSSASLFGTTPTLDSSPSFRGEVGSVIPTLPSLVSFLNAPGPVLSCSLSHLGTPIASDGLVSSAATSPFATSESNSRGASPLSPLPPVGTAPRKAPLPFTSSFLSSCSAAISSFSPSSNSGAGSDDGDSKPPAPCALSLLLAITPASAVASAGANPSFSKVSAGGTCSSFAASFSWISSVVAHKSGWPTSTFASSGPESDNSLRFCDGPLPPMPWSWPPHRSNTRTCTDLTS